MKYIIYHRYPSYETVEEAQKIVDTLEEKIKGFITNIEIVIEEANNFQSQHQLERIITNLKVQNHDPNEVTILCYNFNSLINDSLITAINHLAELLKYTRVEFLHTSSQSLTEFTVLMNYYKENRESERGKLIAYRIAKNGVFFGRPPVAIDVDEAIRLREMGLSYEQISKKMNRSLSLIYSKLPKEIRVKFRNMRFARCGRPLKIEKLDNVIGEDKQQ